MKTSRRLLANQRRRRRLQIEQLEARFVLSGQAVLANDAFTIHQNGPQTPLQVLANDSFDADYAGRRLITSVSFGSQGGRLTISADKHALLYTPPADYAGTETFVYAVDGQYTAQVEVSILAPLSGDSYQVVPDGNERTFNVLDNDPFWSGYAGAKKITSVSVGSAGGTVKIAPDRKSILYMPADGVEGSETFTYVVDDLYPAQVTVSIPNTLNGDSLELVKYVPPAVLEVMGNDPFWAGYTGAKKITQVESSRIGATIQISSDGKSLIYTQPSSFADREFSYVVYDTFHYVVDGKYEASVTLALHRPVRDDWFSVDANSQDYFYDVTANDTYNEETGHPRDVIDRVTSVTQSTKGGTVTISADGKGVLYTPAPGFVGDDDFTYIADGVHLARVDVHVTRPVRDDTFSTGVYQDTPNAVLNVLANDFLGNGYVGARLITAVGAPEHGGTVTIRSDGKAIIYTPAIGYTGTDNFTYTVDGLLEATVSLQVAPLAQPDIARFYPEPSARPYTIDVLANDYFSQGYAGARVVTSVEVVDGSGQVSIQNNRVVFDAASAGAHTLHYTVDGQYQGTVFVWIENVAFPDQAVVDENSAPREIQVLGNDFYINYPPYSYPGPRLITGVTQSVHGGTVTVSADGRTVQYQPAADFIGEDTFTYTVDNFMTATVTVEVIRRVRDDQFRVDAADGPQTLPVLVNDPFGADYAGPGQITAVTPAAGGGTVAISPDGHSLVYTPRAGFAGTDTFTYTVDGTQKAEVSVVVDSPQSELAQKFSSLDAYVQFLINDALARYDSYFGQPVYRPTYLAGANTGGFVAFSPDVRGHSETNVQVAGVDEGDLVEFDSDYIYSLGGGDLVILNAWPADQLSIASRTAIEGQPIAEFLHGNRLTIISAPVTPWSGGLFGDWSWSNSQSGTTIVTVLDVSNRSVPTVVQMTKMDGRYIDSRAVGDSVYVLVENSNAVAPQPIVVDADNDPTTMNRFETREEYLARVMANVGELVEDALPSYTASGPDGQTVRAGLLNSPEDIYKPLADGATNLISVVSFDATGNEPGFADTSAVYTTGASTIYASLDHFYVFDTAWTREDGAMTRAMKFNWQPATGGIDFDATTTVPGSIINQFSVDESDGYLRIATTVRNQNAGNWTSREENTLFVLQEDDGVFEYVGGLQNLALGESIRSVRFLGDRAFITTFRDVDPLFAIDLSDPTHPESVGHITIPGFTSYMQLIDANHLLTVGHNTPYGATGPTQVSLFDISDLLQPRRIAEYTFERFSTSEAALDHHAFGYYADFGLLAMPVSTAHIERVDLDGDGYREASQTVNDYRLAVFSIDVNAANPEDRLTLTSEIEHGASVRRSGFIGDKLYSIADDSVKVVDIGAPNIVVGEVEIPPAVDPSDNVPVFVINQIDLGADGRLLVPTRELPEDPLVHAIDRTRAALAEQLGGGAAEPLVVTAEASASAADVYFVVCRVADQNYLYQASADGTVQLLDANYHLSSAAGAWHAVYATAPQNVVIDEPPAPVEVRAPIEAIEIQAPQSPTLKPSMQPHETRAENVATSYFADLGTDDANACQNRRIEKAFRQLRSDVEDSQLLLLTAQESRWQNRGESRRNDSSIESDAKDGDCDLSNVDDAFESLHSFRTAKKLRGQNLAGWR